MKDCITRYNKSLKDNSNQKPTALQQFALEKLNFWYQEPNSEDEALKIPEYENVLIEKPEIKLIQPTSQKLDTAANTINLCSSDEDTILTINDIGDIKAEKLDYEDDDLKEMVVEKRILKIENDKTEYVDTDLGAIDFEDLDLNGKNAIGIETEYVDDALEDSNLEAEVFCNEGVNDENVKKDKQEYTDDYYEQPISYNDNVINSKGGLEINVQNSKSCHLIDDLNQERAPSKCKDNFEVHVSSLGRRSESINPNWVKKNKKFDINAIMHTHVPKEILIPKTKTAKQQVSEEAQIVYNAFSHVPEPRKSLVFLKLSEAYNDFKSSK